MVDKKNILLLTKNFSNYRSGNYHDDIVQSFMKKSNCIVYGPGYPQYKKNFSIEDIISYFSHIDFDLIVFNTSWDDDTSETNVDPNPNINLSKIKIPKIYFLNKEYKKLKERLEFAKNNAVDLVISVSPECNNWDKKISFLHLNFGISLDRFKPLNLNRYYDFGFTGNLHRMHTDSRFNVKKKIFKKEYMHKKSNLGLENFLKQRYENEILKNKKIYWAEWGAKSYFNQTLLPNGFKYTKLLNSCKTYLNTPSAAGIFGTRFFELMACKTAILCPADKNYFGILKDGYNCIMFNSDASDFYEKLNFILSDKDFYDSITEQAYSDVQSHSYDNRIESLLKIFR